MACIDSGFEPTEPDGEAIALDACAALILDLRQRRTAELGADLFTDPAWDILLVLARRGATGGAPKRELAKEIGGSDEAVRRWTDVLVGRGHIEGCAGDSYRLTDNGRSALSRILLSEGQR